MSRAARVLMIAAQDVGGSLYYLGQELRRQGKFQCRLLTLGRDERAAFPGDLDQIYDGGEELKALLAAADVLHLVDCLPEELNLFGRPLSEWIESRRRLKVALQFDGRTPIVSGKAGEARVQTAKERGWSTWSTRPGLATRLGIDFLPPFIPWWRGPWSPLAPGTRKRESLRRPGVIFASSRVPLEKRSPLEALVDQSEDEAQRSAKDRERPLFVETLVAKDHRTILRRRRFAHLCLSHCEDGLSLSALESLAQGVPVVASVSPEAERAYRELGEGVSPPVGKPRELGVLIDRIEAREEGPPALRSWVRRALSPDRWFDRCERAWSPE